MGYWATERQKDYISVLLEKLGQDISDFTDEDIDDLSVREASDLIEELKDRVSEEDAWED